MSHPVRVSLRAPPHLPFIQGFPGIPGGPSRRPPGIHGTVEVRVGAVPIKAKWVRVEIRKHETIPPGFKTSSSEDKTTWEHVGEIQTLWQCTTPNKEFDILETADFKFFLPLPENIPPTVMMMKDSGIRYELVAAVCYKQKGGMFKKDASSVNKVTEDLRITKHELNSAWPLYNQPDEFNATGKGQVSMTVQRPYSAFGPNDRILLTAVLRSNEPKPFRVKGFECTLLEVVTITQVSLAQDKRKSKKVPPPTTKSRTVATARYPIDETLGKGGEKSARIDIPMSADKLLVTVRNGRSIEVGYELEVKAVCDGTPEIVIKGIKYVVGPFSRGHSQQAVRDIGHFPPLCPGPSAPHSSNPPSTRPDSPPTSPHASPPIGPPRTFTPSNPISRELGQPDFPPGFSGHPLSRPPVQGFEPTPMDNRRKSSSTITTTTTTHEFGGPPMAMAMSNSGSRSYSTMPVGRNSMPVPAPYHNGHLLRTPSYGSSVDRPLSPQLESPTTRPDEGDMRNKRYSTMTTGTFGMRDRDQLESLAETEYAEPPNGARTPTRTPGPPSAWLPAEQEKQRLYNEARARAANIQSQTGASMQDIGMDAPPDYDTPSRHTQLSSGGSSPVIPALVLTAAEEKEQQRKRYEAATGSGSGSGTGTAPAPQSPAIGQPSFLTAAEEKEIQKKRYNDAVSRGGGSSNDRPSSPMTGGMPWATLSAAEEKELQRKRYEEAAGRVASDMGHSSAGSPFASGTSTPTRTEDPIPYNAIYPSRDQRPTSRIVSNPISSTPSSPLAPASSSRRPTSMQVGPTPALINSRQLPPSGAIDEKAQMKRYYEALDKVNNAAGGSGSGVGSNSYADQPPPLESAPPPASSKPTAYLSAAEEKEQMKRRFEEASSRVNQVQGSGLRVEEPNASGSSARAPAPNASSQYMSAEEEKEQMRKRYEAATAAVGGSPSLDRSVPNGHGHGHGHSQGSGGGSGSGQTPKPYLSATEEKEQMRKRFEDATAAVNRQSTRPAQAQSPRQMSSGSGGGSGSGSGGGSGSKPATYLTAAEEKEQMRRRFEEATAAVNRTSTQPRDDPPPIDSYPQGQGSGSGSASQPPAAYMSAAEEKEQMRKRFESAQAAVSQKSPPLTQTRKVSAPIDPNAPPPPLPTRPPVEYITLLSPVDDERPPWNKVERFGMTSPGAGGSGQGEASGKGR